jgi:hypothetical protein
MALKRSPAGDKLPVPDVLPFPPKPSAAAR